MSEAVEGCQSKHKPHTLRGRRESLCKRRNERCNEYGKRTKQLMVTSQSATEYFALRRFAFPIEPSLAIRCRDF